MKGRVQIVGRLPVELNRRVRAAAKRQKVSVRLPDFKQLAVARRSPLLSSLIFVRPFENT